MGEGGYVPCGTCSHLGFGPPEWSFLRSSRIQGRWVARPTGRDAGQPGNGAPERRPRFLGEAPTDGTPPLQKHQTQFQGLACSFPVPFTPCTPLAPGPPAQPKPGAGCSHLAHPGGSWQGQGRVGRRPRQRLREAWPARGSSGADARRPLLAAGSARCTR